MSSVAPIGQNVEVTVQEPTPGLAEAVSRVGDRWTLLVIDALLAGPRRFGDLQEGVPGVATNVLSSRLKQLERNGLVVARPYSQRPLRVEYQLTALGQELAGALRLLASWGTGDDAHPRHGRCGGPLELRWWCPRCNEPADPEADDDLHWL